ncbi:MAG TPA: NrfD/PsrC family molybdoenzyme membrane anchor subunit [Anaerolineales bacterium]|nr:NrfD/PsrC family molybdoenzyme membrane anchor subunit [Anaerolineales bacterium]
MATSTARLKLPSLSPGFLAWLGLIAICLLIGLAAAFEIFRRGLVVTNMSDLVPWGLWITIDLSAIALGAGAFTLSAVVYLFGLKKFQSIVRLAVFVGFIGYTTALLTLVMDIGRPDRFWHPWVYWNIHSVLWEITWCITIYLTIMILEFAPVVFEARFFDRWPWLRRLAHTVHKIAPALALLGLMVSLLHQSSLGATYGIIKSRPIWFKPSMPIMFILSAVAVGPALTMAVAFILEWVTGKRTVPHNILRIIARTSGLTLLVYAYIKFWDLAAVSYYGRTPAVSESLHVLNSQTPYTFGFWVGEMIIGILIPALMFLVPRFNQRSTNLVFGAFCAILGIIFNRWNVTVTGLFVPVNFSPGTLYHLPAGQYLPGLFEWAIAVGIIGYVMLMLTLGVRYLPLFPKNEPH